MKNWMELLLQNQEEKDQKDLEVVHGALAEMVGQELTWVNSMEQFNLCLYAQGIRERQERRRLKKQMEAEYEQFRKTIWLPPHELALEHDEDAQMYLDKAGQFRFRMKARNGKIIGTSEGYTGKAGCLNGIESVRTNAPEAETEE